MSWYRLFVAASPASDRGTRTLSSCLADPFSHDQQPSKQRVRTKILEGVGGVSSEGANPSEASFPLPPLGDHSPLGAPLVPLESKHNSPQRPLQVLPAPFLPLRTRLGGRLHHRGSRPSLLSYKTQGRLQPSAGLHLRQPASSAALGSSAWLSLGSQRPLFW